MSDVKLTPGQEWFKVQQPVCERVVTPFFSQHKACRDLEPSVPLTLVVKIETLTVAR